MHTDCSITPLGTQSYVVCAVWMGMRAYVSGPTHVWGAVWDCHTLFSPMVVFQCFEAPPDHQTPLPIISGLQGWDTLSMCVRVRDIEGACVQLPDLP